MVLVRSFVLNCTVHRGGVIVIIYYGVYSLHNTWINFTSHDTNIALRFLFFFLCIVFLKFTVASSCLNSLSFVFTTLFDSLRFVRSLSHNLLGANNEVFILFACVSCEYSLYTPTCLNTAIQTRTDSCSLYFACHLVFRLFVCVSFLLRFTVSYISVTQSPIPNPTSAFIIRHSNSVQITHRLIIVFL